MVIGLLKSDHDEAERRLTAAEAIRLLEVEGVAEQWGAREQAQQAVQTAVQQAQQARAVAEQQQIMLLHWLGRQAGDISEGVPPGGPGPEPEPEEVDGLVPESDRFTDMFADFQVQHLDTAGKGHGKIDVALGDVKRHAFGHQRDPHQNQKTQGQNLDGGMGIDKDADGSGGNHHDAHGNDDGNDHHRQVLGQTDGGDHRIQGEDNVEITGVDGSFCSPECSNQDPCPTDVPDGATAEPQCVLKMQNGKENCALICNPNADDQQCPKHASCKSIQSTGVCTYDN